MYLMSYEFKDEKERLLNLKEHLKSLYLDRKIYISVYDKKLKKF